MLYDGHISLFGIETLVQLLEALKKTSCLQKFLLLFLQLFFHLLGFLFKHNPQLIGPLLVKLF